tara:strand:- start:1482 stop:2315 length:834 start_codon:yes stop_codon:yes gene_type:complete
MAKRKVNRGKFVTKTQAEKDAEQFTSSKTSEMFQKLGTQIDRQQKQTLTDRDTQIGGVANLDSRVANQVEGYDSAKNLSRSADIAIAQTQVQAAANNLEERDKAQRNLAFVKGGYEDASIKGGKLLKEGQQAASMSLGKTLAEDSIRASKYGAMTAVVGTAAQVAAKEGTGVDVDTNNGSYYDAQGNPLSAIEYEKAVKAGTPVFSKNKNMFMGFSGKERLTASDALGELPRNGNLANTNSVQAGTPAMITNPLEIVTTGNTTKPNSLATVPISFSP